MKTYKERVAIAIVIVALAHYLKAESWPAELLYVFVGTGALGYWVWFARSSTGANS